MSANRREFLRAGGTILAAGFALPRHPRLGRPPLRFEQADVKALSAAALDAARSAGAAYTEVKLSEYRRKDVGTGTGSGGGPAGTTYANVYGTQSDGLGLGVRALVDGAWGFASGILWTTEDATRLGRQAVVQAKTMRQPGMAAVELAPVPVVRDGRWDMPVERDPFDVPREEMIDVLTGTTYYTLRRWGHPMLQAICHRWDTAFATSEGTFITQKRYGTQCHMFVGLRPVAPVGIYSAPMSLNRLLPLSGRGWEYIATAPFHEHIERVREDAERFNALPLKSLEVGRYDTVLDATTAARMLSVTLGSATELDRAMGYEANAGGTSYLNDPTAMLGNEIVAAPTISVTANRSLSHGLATVKWDDEGVEPEEFTLVRNGVLADYQTTRESVTWLKEGYARLSRPLRSHGCAGSATAREITQAIRPNLRLHPGRDGVTFESLKEGLVNGIVIENAAPDVDFNGLNGMAVVDPEVPDVRFTEIKRGKRTARFDAGAVALLFRAPEFWRGIAQLGGAASVRHTPVSSRRGEPAQQTWHTVEAPPLLVKQASIIDPTR